jgi:hypothetical protein
MFYRGEVLKTINMEGGSCVEIVVRLDGMFQFIHRTPARGDDTTPVPQESGPYISAETAEKAARLKFKL